MDVVLYERAADFAAVAEPFYARDPDRHTIALTVLDRMVRTGDAAAALATVHADGELVGALLCSPQRPPIVSGVAPEQAEAVVDALAEAGFRASGARGHTAAAEAFAAAHVARHGGRAVVRRATRLFALDTLIPPDDVPGSARPATAADGPLVYGWYLSFLAEAAPPGEFVPTLEDFTQEIVDLEGAVQLWTVDGQPVAYAAARGPAAGMARIGPVYTPPEQRGHGYGAAATVAATAWALDAGATRVVLFTDLANPISNRLYPRVGFVPVHDALDVDFDCEPPQEH
jgi:GNAT superfamily N-acetyltransferase